MSLKPVYVIIGIPGSGKDTQAEILARTLRLPHLDAGKTFSRVLEEKGDASEEIARTFKQSQPVPTEIFMDVIFRELQNRRYSDGFVFTQNTRSVEEADRMLRKLMESGFEVVKVILLEVSKDTAIKRNLERFHHGSTPKDPDVPTLIARIENYYRTIESIKKYYSDKQLLSIVDAEAEVDDIAEHIVESMQPVMVSKVDRKFQKIGEHGFGNHVVAFVSEREISTRMVFHDIVEKGVKIHYYFIDIREPFDEQQRKLIHSLQYLHYASTLILDSLAFELFYTAADRLMQSMTLLNEIIIYDPVALKPGAFSFLHPKHFSNIEGKRLPFSKKSFENYTGAVSKIPLVAVKKTNVVAFTDKPGAFKLAAKIKSSNYVACSNYKESIEALLNLLSKS